MTFSFQIFLVVMVFVVVFAGLYDAGSGGGGRAA